MDQIYLKVLNKYPEILIKPKIKEIISYGNIDLVYPLLWIYQYYFDYNLIIFLPKYKNVSLDFKKFNDFIDCRCNKHRGTYWRIYNIKN